MRKKRKYNMGRRADQIRQTRARIVVAAMELHEELGPARTTISAIAERAGVERLTVYRHFPDDASLFNACTSHWLSLHPPPDPADWADIKGPRERVKAAIRAFAHYYSDTAPMWKVTYRDFEDVPALAAALGRFHEHLDEIGDELLEYLKPPLRQRPRVRAILNHAIDFHTWQSLNQKGLNSSNIAALLVDCIFCALRPV